MTPYGLARIGPHVPLAPRRLMAQLSQMATRHLGGCPRKTRPALSAIVAVGEA
jgi:hypothetical protein